jgi:hypothetical protein
VRRPRPTRIAVFVVLGAFVTVMVCVALAATDDLTTGIATSAEGYLSDDRWSVTRYDRPAGVRVVSQYTAGRNWSPGQALGPPDTPTGGDQVTAWASASSDGQREWLLLDFATPVVPKAVRVFEMCSTGALDKVEVTKPDGTEMAAWSGVDPLPKKQSMGTSEVPISGVDFPVSRVRLHFDSPNVSGWNEVDAVGLVAKDGGVQYAVAAQASSIYGADYPSTVRGTFASPVMLVPGWSGIEAPKAPATFTVDGDRVQRTSVRPPGVIAEARGWPMLALAGRKEIETALASVNSGFTSYPGPYSGSISSSYPVGSTGAMPSGSYTSLVLTGSTLVSPSYPPGMNKPVMLYRPIPLGFAVNTALAALVLWLIYAGLTVPRRFLVEVSRLRRGGCVMCGYDLGYDFVAGCPECGWNRQARGTKPGNGRLSYDGFSTRAAEEAEARVENT